MRINRKLQVDFHIMDTGKNLLGGHIYLLSPRSGTISRASFAWFLHEVQVNVKLFLFSKHIYVPLCNKSC